MKKEEEKKQYLQESTHDLRILCTYCSTFAGDSLETWFDARHRTSRPAGLALQEEETGVILQDCLGRSAGVTCYILLNIPAKWDFNQLQRAIRVGQVPSLTFSAHSQFVSVESVLWWWAASFRRLSRSYPTQRAKSREDVSAVCNDENNNKER